VMAAAGLAALGFFYFGIRRPRLTLWVMGGGLILLVAATSLLPDGRWGTFDPEWLALVRERAPYVFLTNWSLDDWGRAAIPLATLAIGATVLTEQRARLLSQVALCTALTGLILTFVACDISKWVLFTQLQPWRWQWLAVTVAAVLLPSIAAAGWNRSDAGKIAVTLLASAWLFGSDELALLTSVAAITTLWLPAWEELRLVRYGALALATIALVSRIASNLLFMEVHYSDPQIPLWIRKMASLCGDGSLPVAVIVLAIWLAGRQRRAAGLAILGV